MFTNNRGTECLIPIPGGDAVAGDGRVACVTADALPFTNAASSTNYIGKLKGCNSMSRSNEPCASAWRMGRFEYRL